MDKQLIVVASNTQRPVRRDFYSNVVIANNGEKIDEGLVKEKLTASESKLVRRQLRANGWTMVRVFDREGYTKAFDTYRSTRKAAEDSKRSMVIHEAFEGVEQNHRVERALATLLPLYGGVQDRKIVDSFKKIVRVVAHTATESHAH